MNNLDELISGKISSFNLKVEQAFEFYKIIGDEDQKGIQEMIIKLQINDDDDYINNNFIYENELLNVQKKSWNKYQDYEF